MPSVFTHYLCGSKMLELIKYRVQKDRLLHYRQVFNLGTQGPDVLFYYRVWPWTRSEGVEKIGERMHGEKVEKSFSSALEYVNQQESSDKSLLTSYLCGYACHYCLDFMTHPYIFYKSGFTRPGEAPSSKYTYYHRRFETALDVLMLKRLLALKPFEANAAGLIRIGAREAYAIGKMTSHVLEEVYDEKVNPEQVSRAILDMISVQNILRDRTGLKKKSLQGIEKALGLYPLFSSMIHPPFIADNLDYLNLAGAPWHYPWDLAVKCKCSFTEMFDSAAQEANGMCEAIQDYLWGSADIMHPLNIIGNRSFSTGMDCNLELQFMYFDCIFEPLR